MVYSERFEAEGLSLKFLGDSRYLGTYLGPRKELESWVRTQVEAWSHGIYSLNVVLILNVHF